jgi:hypothetical protein
MISAAAHGADQCRGDSPRHTGVLPSRRGANSYPIDEPLGLEAAGRMSRSLIRVDWLVVRGAASAAGRAHPGALWPAVSATPVRVRGE